MNGVINFSVLDGWWDEGYDGATAGRSAVANRTPDEGAQDWADAQDLYRLLENEIVPTFYERDKNGMPTRWIELMKESMASTIWEFSTTRMLQEYVEQLYLPAAEHAPSEPETGSQSPRPELVARGAATI